MPTQRENLLRLWRRQGFDFAPVEFELCPAMEEKYRARHGGGVPYQEFFSFPWRTVKADLLRQDVDDWSRFHPGAAFLPGTAFDKWGVAHEPHATSMHMTRMHHPLRSAASLEEIESYPYPAFDPSGMETARAEVASAHARGLAAMATQACSIWEIAWYMRGMEEMMLGMLDDDRLTAAHLERMTVLQEQRAAAYAEAGVDVLHLGDDIGEQRGPLMAPELYRVHLKPRLKRVIDAARRVRPDLLVSYHSCGHIAAFIDDLIEAGVDILNPVQPECMDFADVHARYGDRLSFWGTLGTQTTIPFGAPDEVAEAVRRNLTVAGPKGGLLCAPTHLIEPEVPWDNIEAYVAACRSFAG